MTQHSSTLVTASSVRMKLPGCDLETNFGPNKSFLIKVTFGFLDNLTRFSVPHSWSFLQWWTQMGGSWWLFSDSPCSSTLVLWWHFRNANCLMDGWIKRWKKKLFSKKRVASKFYISVMFVAKNALNVSLGLFIYFQTTPFISDENGPGIFFFFWASLSPAPKGFCCKLKIP